MSHPYDDLVHRHITAWNLDDADERRAGFEAIYVPDIRLFEVQGNAIGYDAVNKHVTALHSQIPGFTLALFGPIQTHNDIALASWTFSPANGPVLATGKDVFHFRDGRISAIYVFIDD